MDDQVLFNKALEKAGIKWKKVPAAHTTSVNENTTTFWQGRTSSGLKVTLLPQEVACRGISCVQEMKENAYIWHHGRNKHKFQMMSSKAEEDGVWFLRKDWASIDGSQARFKGLEWLLRISLQKIN